MISSQIPMLIWYNQIKGDVMNINEIEKNNNLRANEVTILKEILLRIQNGRAKIPIREVAKSSYVSTTSIVRLAKKLGYSGYNEMLYSLKGDLVSSIEYRSSDAIRSITMSEASLNTIDTLIQEILSLEYERFHVIGIGYSGYVAEYFCDKLLELDYFATTKSPLDFEYYKKSLILFISESGETQDLIFIEERCQALGYSVYVLSANMKGTLCQHVKNSIILKKGREQKNSPNYFIGNGINLVESVLAIIKANKKERV